MLETEVKFLIPDLARFRQRLLAAGGRPVHPRVHEVNLRFDDAGGSLARAGAVLRLRQDERARLTLKRRPADGVRSEAKRLEELEVGVDDFDSARAILEGLGLRASLMYEKYREAFALGPAEVVLDELPYGRFVEIEAPDAPALRNAARALDLRWDRRYVGSYIDLLDRVRRRRQLNFRDLSFANFEGLTISPADLGVEPAEV